MTTSAPLAAVASILLALPFVDAAAQMPTAVAACGWKEPVPAGDHRLVVTPDTLLAIRRLLMTRQFVALERALARYDSAARADVRNEEAWISAYRTFGSPDARLTAPLDDWVRSDPKSWRARAVRARHRWEVTNSFRGAMYGGRDSLMDDKKALEWSRRMQEDMTVLLGTKEPPPPVLLLLAQIAEGEGSRPRAALQQAINVSPLSVVIREQLQRAIRPRLDGTYREMEAAANSAQAYAKRNPRLRILLGFVAWDSADITMRAKNPATAVRKADEAISYGDAADFRLTRAEIHYRLEHWEAALADLDCGLALAPWRYDDLALRGMLRIYLGHTRFGGPGLLLQRQGAADLSAVAELDPDERELERALLQVKKKAWARPGITLPSLP